MSGSTQSTNRKVKVKTLITSRYFKLGMADYLAGQWSEICGVNWYRLDAGVIYELGRQYAALMGDNPPTVERYRAAKAGGML